MRYLAFETLMMSATKVKEPASSSYIAYRVLSILKPLAGPLLCARHCGRYCRNTEINTAHPCFPESHGVAGSIEQETDLRFDIKDTRRERSMANNTYCCTPGLPHNFTSHWLFLQERCENSYSSWNNNHPQSPAFGAPRWFFYDLKSMK